MRFLPVFLDLQAGSILLVGAGELAQAKLRLLLAAGAQVRWHALDGRYDASGQEVLAGVTRDEDDPLTTDLTHVIAVLCAGAGPVGHAV
ncbi:NAD(P)-dependent oxidoreductase, partial [Klebsiella pneumoniae]|uniref:NAD(P)-dependent oxidoreductase n=1 Tax=Klebsiella pneumoniae TaxID=573 RepID=UPI00371C91B1